MSIQQALRSHVIRECFDSRPPAAFDDDYDLIENGHMDSLRLMGLISFIEQEFEAQLGINDMVPKHFRSVSAMAGYVQRRLGQGAAGA